MGSVLFGSVVQFTSGYTIHGGRKWGRTLYTVYAPLSLLLGTWLAPSEAAPPFAWIMGLVFVGILLTVLYRPESNRFFEGTYVASEDTKWPLRKHKRSERNPSDLAQVFGVILLIGSGFLFSFAFTAAGFAESREWFLFILLGGWVPAIVCLIGGIFLWGRKRWAGAAGWVLLLSGGLLSVNLLFMYSMFTSPWWENYRSQILEEAGDPAAMAAMGEAVLPVAIASAFIALIGASLLWLQRDKDRGAVQIRAEHESAS